MDNMDQSQINETRHHKTALDVWRTGQSEAKVSREDCVDCGDPIDLKRQQALSGVVRCVECQDAFERGNLI